MYNGIKSLRGNWEDNPVIFYATPLLFLYSTSMWTDLWQRTIVFFAASPFCCYHTVVADSFPIIGKKNEKRKHTTEQLLEETNNGDDEKLADYILFMLCFFRQRARY